MVIERIFRFFSSLKLTVVLLTLAMLLVFLGTLAQVEVGLYKAQHDYFRSVFVYWGPKGSSLKIPWFPGGYLLGVALLLNLVAAHFERFKPKRNKVGVALIHGGLVLLLIGQLATDMLSRESSLHLREGETRNYTEADSQVELAIVDVTDADSDKVVAIPGGVLKGQSSIRHPELPFTIEVRRFHPNSTLADRPKDSTEPMVASQGYGPMLLLKAQPVVTAMEERDIPSSVIEMITPEGSLGTWLVSGYIAKPQTLAHKGRTYELALRRARLYKPFSIQLLDFKHDVYPGTEIPKNFSSRVRVVRPGTGEDREELIYMNNPLRYGGDTYYQASFDTDNEGTILQVVHNPSWLAPYAACVLVSAGLVIQFMSHMVGFVRKRSSGAEAMEERRSA